MQYPAEETEKLIELSARQGNILPIISPCDSKCVFCSHKNNPPEVRVASIGVRGFEDIDKTMRLLSPEREITIGESATRIIEGEPTLHPRFVEIIELLRLRFPDTIVAVTTNGHHLTQELVKTLARLGGILINLSLNSASHEGRRLLMGDDLQQAETAINGVRLLNRYAVAFQGSLVAMPDVTGYDDIKHTIHFLAENGAQSVRIFAPGFSRYVHENLFSDGEDVMPRLRKLISELSPELPCPVLLEPSGVSDLRAVCSGVVKDSPAWNAGLRRGDELLSIDGRAPRCRAEAFGMLEAPGKRELGCICGGRMAAITLEYGQAGASGIAMEYDFDADRAEYIANAVRTAPGHVLALTSEFAYDVFCAILERFNAPAGRITVKPVPNLTFGGTIKAAGLLCIADYISGFEEYCLEHDRPDCVMLPAESFDYLGYDLTGRHFSQLKEVFKVPAITL